MDINVSSIIFQIPNFIRVHFFLNINIKKIKRFNSKHLISIKDICIFIHVYEYLCMSKVSYTQPNKLH
ncbi:hypothetical protein PFAG_06166 [Plasmodium falciparum Santa Lucia]|uniref:Uncharacterized protein n=2 Tax=Plasmodium falciparum TaxID=5833 RepID=W7F8W0_PLAFA|nr:hypothetical protein PFNF135_02798 [Plasmodium falciparum NF135/5.C10]EUT64259.1 hypothetical protein PFAG_06166 [Plasmodium falciparum Santa Lucia]